MRKSRWRKKKTKFNRNQRKVLRNPKTGKQIDKRQKKKSAKSLLA